MHRAGHRVEDMAIKVRKAHSLLVDPVFPYTFGRLLPFWCDAESPAILQWTWIEGKHRHRHSVLLGDLGADRLRALMTVIEYKGYRIEVCPVGKGWRASIFSPGSTTPWPNSPVNLEKSSTEEIVAEAKRIIEVRLGPRLL